MLTPVTPKAGRILIDPAQASNPVGSQHTITVVVYDTNGKPMANVRVKISHTGANSFSPIELTTDGNGKCSYCYTGKNTGTDIIVATVDSLSAKATKEWYSLKTPLTVPPALK
jgi:5-hydroxyisourate hydrolase-like protein (transthyretin family)